jgi:hypothetical protein
MLIELDTDTIKNISNNMYIHNHHDIYIYIYILQLAVFFGDLDNTSITCEIVNQSLHHGEKMSFRFPSRSGLKFNRQRPHVDIDNINSLVGKGRHALLPRGGRRGFDPRQLRRTKRAFFSPLAK